MNLTIPAARVSHHIVHNSVWFEPDLDYSFAFNNAPYKLLKEVLR